uniref:Small ribosomal subunit protein uS3m n=1 Tax=Apiotrichum gamsii TaxID=1105092 RepID=A0A8K1ZR70_9TREE|nr:ribosomal protein S3 [Apiotrichum gamsii]
MQRLKNKYLSNRNLSNSYTFTNQNKENFLKIEKNRKIIISEFYNSIEVLSSKEIFTVTRNKVIITNFYYCYEPTTGLNENTINNLGLLLNKIYHRPVELHIIKLSYPYLDRNILAQFVRKQTIKWRFKKIQKQLFKSIPLSRDGILGIKIIISGRLTTERKKPRITVSTSKIGSFRTFNNKNITDNSSYTYKNSNGAFTVKISINQIDKSLKI